MSLYPPMPADLNPDDAVVFEDSRLFIYEESTWDGQASYILLVQHGLNESHDFDWMIDHIFRPEEVRTLIGLLQAAKARFKAVTGFECQDMECPPW